MFVFKILLEALFGRVNKRNNNEKFPRSERVITHVLDRKSIFNFTN